MNKSVESWRSGNYHTAISTLKYSQEQRIGTKNSHWHLEISPRESLLNDIDVARTYDEWVQHLIKYAYESYELFLAENTEEAREQRKKTRAQQDAQAALAEEFGDIATLGFLRFIEENCVLTPAGRVSPTVVYTAYTSSLENFHDAIHSLSAPAFAKALLKEGFTPEKSNGKRYWKGLTLRRDQPAYVENAKELFGVELTPEQTSEMPGWED